MAEHPPWHRSPYDQLLHMFRDKPGETAEALCTHSVPRDKLEEAGDDDKACHICILVFGDELADKLGDPGNFRG